MTTTVQKIGNVCVSCAVIGVGIIAVVSAAILVWSYVM